MSSNGSPQGDGSKALVLAATDIVELIGQSVALKRRGKDFIGLCPFHQEKTPSFHVSPSKQFFHCYGCKAGGNAIDFVIKRDRIEFLDALKTLADRAGIELPRFGGSREKTSEKQAILEVNSAACSFFEKLLAHPQEGQSARTYLKERGIDAESIKRFQIGCAPNGWDGLLKSPVARKFNQAILVKAGLAKERISDHGEISGCYDTFRNRLMFPIRDESARVIAFGGRVMPGSEDPAKYLNSPETPLFSKGRCVFGLDLARPRIVEKRWVAVVEGYTDVVMAHQYGVTNVVSVLGTALTEQHVTILRRFADKIVLLFDPDTAGDAAVNRAVELFLTQPVEIAIASIPQGQDPDEFLLANGAEAFEKVLTDAADALTFKWKQLTRQFSEADGLTGKQKAVEEYLETLSGARGSGPVDGIRWGAALARVSRLTEIGINDLNRRFKTRPQARGPAQVAADAGPTNTSPVVRKPLTGQDRAERELLGLLLTEPKRWHDVQQVVSVTEFTDPLRRRLAELYWQHQRDEGDPVFNEFLGDLSSPELVELAIELVEMVEQLPDPDVTLAGDLAFLAEVKERETQTKLMAESRRTEDQPLGEQAEIDLLKRLQRQARPDLRRVGS